MSEAPATDAEQDTIAAVATPPGRGGVGVVRVSGVLTRHIAKSVLGNCPAPRHAAYRKFRDAGGEPIDEGIALFFRAPASFTGEDVLELQGHGGPQVMDMLMARVLALGARPARPGEFSMRAFLNDRLDLAQAEAIADLIESGSEAAARAALRSMQGEFSRHVNELAEALTELRMYTEAAIDFPEEEIDFLSDPELSSLLEGLFARFDALHSVTRQGCLLQEGMTVVIAGPPNAGKSSLLNRLAGYDAAIVTAMPGTTRDVLQERIAIDGMPLHVLDTAGLRDAPDAIEQEGVRRARAAARSADRVLLVVDANTSVQQEIARLLREFPKTLPVTVVRNKIDLSGELPGCAEGPRTTLSISAKTGAGLAELRAHLKKVMGFESPGSGTLSARRRHLQALADARAHAEEGGRQLLQAKAGELMAEELRLAQQALGEITGEVSSDDLLGRIFSSFCVGK